MKLLEKITEQELRYPISRWTGNDDSNCFKVCKVNVTKTRDLVLRWRKSKHDAPVMIGYFRMWPENLIREGYCREVAGKIVISLFHQADGRITLSRKRDDREVLEAGAFSGDVGRDKQG